MDWAAGAAAIRAEVAAGRAMSDYLSFERSRNPE